MGLIGYENHKGSEKGCKMTHPAEKISVSRTDCQRTIRFNSLSDLHHAILVFGSNGDQSARQHNIQAYGQSDGGLGALLFMKAWSGGESSFAQGIVREIGNLDSPYGRSWDYDGPGPFHKTAITAERQSDGTFTLEVCAAGVGNKPEIKLAERFGAPIGYYHCTIQREYAASRDGRFRIPLSDVTDIYKAVGVDIDPKSAFTALTTKTTPQKEWDRPKLPQAALSSDGDVEVTMGFVGYTTVAWHEEGDSPDRDYGYRIEDGFLTGPARQERDGGYESVCIAVRIQPHKIPTFDKAVEQRIRQTGDVIEAIWGGNNAPGSKPGFKSNGMEPV
jgi:hypothetical protein